MLASLSHPNLPRVTACFVLPPQEQCLVMEFIEGGDLQEMLDASGPLPEEQVRDWLGQVCDAFNLSSRAEDAHYPP